MKLQRTTLILILLALSLGSFVYFYEIRGANQREEAQEKKQQIFSFKADDIQSLTVKTKTTNLNLERNGQPDGSKWLLKTPVTASASDASVSYLLNLLIDGKSERTLSVSANQLPEFGLDQPQASIYVKLKNQKTHKLILGKSDFNQRFLYAQADPASPLPTNQSVDILLVSTDFENAVNREISEWKQPIESQRQKPSPNPANKNK